MYAFSWSKDGLSQSLLGAIQQRYRIQTISDGSHFFGNFSNIDIRTISNKMAQSSRQFNILQLKSYARNETWKHALFVDFSESTDPEQQQQSHS